MKPEGQVLYAWPMNSLSLIAFFSGAAIAAQAGLNAQLGVWLKNPFLATVVAFAASLMVIGLSVLVTTREYPSWEAVRAVPWYLWFSGGVLSAFAISMFYFLIPKMGIGQMMAFALSGQLLMAVIASHFGWFDMPQKPLTPSRWLGIVALLVGVILINKE